MHTTASAHRATRRRVAFLGFSHRETASPFVRTIRDALSPIHYTDRNGKRHEALYKSTSCITALERLIDELIRHRATGAQMEAVAHAIASAVVRKVAEARPPLPWAEVVEMEQRADGCEDVFGALCLLRHTAGTRAAWVQAITTHMAAEREVLRTAAALDAQDGTT